MRRSSTTSLRNKLNGTGIILYIAVFLFLYIGVGLALLSTQETGVETTMIVAYGLAVFLVMHFITEPLLTRFFRRRSLADEIRQGVDNVKRTVKPQEEQ